MSDFNVGVINRLRKNQRNIERLESQIEIGRWVDWTPTVTQSGSVTVTVNYATYVVDSSGKVTINCRLTVTGSGTAANLISIGGIPSNAQPKRFGGLTTIGIATIQDSGTKTYGGLSVIATSASEFRFIGFDQANFVGVSPNFALASGDTITFLITYEIS